MQMAVIIDVVLAAVLIVCTVLGWRRGAFKSVIGIGTGPIHEATEREAAAALSYAYEQGVNYLDFATAGAGTFPYVGAVLGPGAEGPVLPGPFRRQL